MREVFNLFSFDSVLQVKRSCYFILTCKTESKENKLKTSLIEIMRLLFNHPIHEINMYVYYDTTSIYILMFIYIVPGNKQKNKQKNKKRRWALARARILLSRTQFYQFHKEHPKNTKF